MENSTVLEGNPIRWRVLADPAPPHNISVPVNLVAGAFGILAANSTTVSNTATVRKRITESEWRDEPTRIRSGDRDGTVTISFGGRIFGDTANPYAFGDPVTVTVLDLGATVVNVSAPGIPVSEGATAVFFVSLMPAPTSDISVNVAYTGGEAALPADAGATSLNLNVNTSAGAGDSMVTATVLTGDGYVVGPGSIAGATVLDADAVVSISASETSVSEGRSAVFTVTANPLPPSQRTVWVDIAVAGGDFEFTGEARREVWLAQGAASATFSVLTLNDEEQESDGSLTATLAAGPGYQIGTTATAAVTIEDNSGDPDVNASGSVDASDALILYYAYALRNDLGNGR